MRGLNIVNSQREFDKLMRKLMIVKCFDSPPPEIDLKEHR